VTLVEALGVALLIGGGFRLSLGLLGRHDIRPDRLRRGVAVYGALTAAGAVLLIGSLIGRLT
jgi:hypothetical protein